MDFKTSLDFYFGIWNYEILISMMAPLYYLLIDFFGMFSYIVTVMHDYDILITAMAF